MNLKQHRPYTRRGKRWEPPRVGGPNAFIWYPNTVQAERRRTYRVTRGKRWDAPVVVAAAPGAPVLVAKDIRQAGVSRAVLRKRGRRWDTFPYGFTGIATQTHCAGSMDSLGDGDVPWTNITNVGASDDQWASTATVMNLQTSDTLATWDFGFSIPSGATILGIQFSLECHNENLGHLQDDGVFLTDAGSQVGADRSYPAGSSFEWQDHPPDVIRPYGAANDLWSYAWTPAKINDPGFGVTIKIEDIGGIESSDPRVDAMCLTVTYGTGLDLGLPGVLRKPKSRVKFQRPSRGKRFDATPPQAAAPPPPFIPLQEIARRRQFAALLRRGKMLLMVPSQDVVEPRIGHRAVRAATPRRGRLWSVIPTGADIFYGLWKPSPTRVRARTSAPRRGRFLQLVSSAAAVPGITRSRRALVGLRRGRRSDTVPAQIVVTPPAYPPQTVSSKRRFMRVWRGKRADVVPPQVVAPTGPALPQTITSKRRFMYIRRGVFLKFPLTGADITYGLLKPKQIPRRLRTMSLGLRRGRTFSAPLAQTTPVTQIRSRIKFSLRKRGKAQAPTPMQAGPINRSTSNRIRPAVRRRGRRWDTIKVAAVIIAAPWVSPIIHSRRAQAMLRRGRRFGNFMVVRTQLHFGKIKTGRIEHAQEGRTWESENTDTEQPKDGDIL